MYQYYKGLLIREGIEGIAPELLRGRMKKLAGAAKNFLSGRMKNSRRPFAIRHGDLPYGIKKNWWEW